MWCRGDRKRRRHSLFRYTWSRLMQAWTQSKNSRMLLILFNTSIMWIQNHWQVTLKPGCFSWWFSMKNAPAHLLLYSSAEKPWTKTSLSVLFAAMQVLAVTEAPPCGLFVFLKSSFLFLLLNYSTKFSPVSLFKGSPQGFSIFCSDSLFHH